MIRLALLRHGPTVWNHEGRLQGRTDIPLHPAAIAELSSFALPPGWAAADLVTSPLKRARQTAELLVGDAARIEPALVEMNWGQFEGARGRDLRADPGSGFRDVEDWGWDYSPPGGESVGALRDRIVPWISTLQKDTIAVSHIGVMRVILALATNWQFEGPAPFRIKRKRLYVVHVDGSDLCLVPDPKRLRHSGL